MKLFYIYIGGKTPTSLIELHDVRFCIGETIEDCHDELRKSWWGTPKSLHMDAWGVLENADGYAIELKMEPTPSEDKLYFVNLGGYDPDEFTELHKNIFIVAARESKAQALALKTVLDWKGRHKDNIFEIEQMFCVSDVAKAKGLYVHLTKTDAPLKPFEFKYGYMPLGKSA